MADHETVHEVRLIITKECQDEPLTPYMLSLWIQEYFQGCDYGSVKIREITTKVDGKEVANKLYK